MAMKKVALWLSLIILIGSFAGCDCGKEPEPPQPQPPVIPKIVQGTVRIGYTSNMIINSQIGLILAHTNILENNALKGEIKTYDSDAFLLEALNRDLIDVAFTTDFPGVQALAKGTNGLILASFGSLGRVGLVVRSDSTIQFIKDLKGLKIGMPAASNAHLHFLNWINKEVIAEKDMSIIKMDSPALVSSLNNKTIDGAVFSDPELLQYELAGTYKRIADNRFTSVVIIKKEYAQKNPEFTKRLLSALKTACYYLTTRQVEINNMVDKTQKIPSMIIPSWSALNHNYMANSADRVNISINKNYLSNLIMVTQYLSNEKLIPKPFDLNSAIDSALQQEGEKKLTPAESDLTKIKIIP
jgi:sulfonate transport system substrate-binding protein